MKAASVHKKNLAALCVELFGAPQEAHVRAAVMRSLCTLPEFLEEVICYYWVFDYSEKEIAHTLNVSEYLIRQRISVAVTLIRVLYAAKPKNPV